MTALILLAGILAWGIVMMLGVLALSWPHTPLAQDYDLDGTPMPSGSRQPDVGSTQPDLAQRGPTAPTGDQHKAGQAARRPGS